MMRITETVKQLMIVNVIFFIGTLIVGVPAFNLLVSHFYKNPDFGIWQIITHMFMHAGFMHLFSNMFGLFLFGSALEERWGSKKFLFFYISCGIGAFMVSQGINGYFFYDSLSRLTEAGFDKPYIIDLLNKGMIDTRWEDHLTPVQFNNLKNYTGVSLGASGAIYGIMVAFAFLYPNLEMMLFLIPIPIKAKYFVSGLVAIDLYMGIKGQALFGATGGIAYFAHFGGALLGYIMMRYWNKNQFNQNRWN
jgi:membrane associated rhomboid family serine protease